MILDAAERHFQEGGPSAVRVQVIAHELGITDAAVHHHFDNRDGLLVALLRRARRKLVGEIEEAVRDWGKGSRDLKSLIDLIADCYARRGYARLATWLTLTGHTGRGSGMLSGLVDALERDQKGQAALTAADHERIQFFVALFHMIQAAEPLFGEPIRRSAGLSTSPSTEARYHAWLLEALETLLAPNSKRVPDARRAKTGSVKGRSHRPSRRRRAHKT